MTTKQAEIGARGEDIATEWLREHGFYIVERNWRVGRYEMDIIAEHYDTMHFVEVKTRKQGGWQSAYDSIDEQKIRSLRRAAMAYRAMHRLRHIIQFDLIAITVDNKGATSVDYVENII
ncbi:MAG: YraN family protein [Alistipes sp.]|nr:YraN family protein [Alistipes sp.]